MTKAMKTIESIEQLYEAFRKAHAAMRKINPDNEEKRFSKAVHKCDSIAWRIGVTPAKNISQMLIKISIARWCTDSVSDLDELENWKPSRFACGLEFNMLASLRDDLRHLTGSIRDPYTTRIRPV